MLVMSKIAQNDYQSKPQFFANDCDCKIYFLRLKSALIFVK